jgi:hypothetical protein
MRTQSINIETLAYINSQMQIASEENVGDLRVVAGNHPTYGLITTVQGMGNEALLIVNTF